MRLLWDKREGRGEGRGSAPDGLGAQRRTAVCLLLLTRRTQSSIFPASAVVSPTLTYCVVSLSLSLSEVAQPQNAHTPNPKYSSRSTYCQPLFFIIIIIMTTGRGGSTRTTCHSRFIHTYAQNSVNQPAKTGSGKSFGADPHLPVGSCHQLAPRHEQRGLSSH